MASLNMLLYLKAEGLKMSKACFKRAALAERQLSFAQGNTGWQHSEGDLTGKLKHVEFIYLFG